MYRLHTIDLYFWTVDDATMFLDSLKRVVNSHQLQVITNPNIPSHSEHKNDVMNPVVAKLEKAAISHTSRNPSISSATQSFPGPPTAPAPTSSPPANNYAPMAYNPAAPAAPEPIAHREKTPPPPDAADGTGLNSAAANDHLAHQYTNPLQASFAPQPTSSQPYMPGPPSRTPTFTGAPGAPGIQRQNTSGSLPPPPNSPPAFAPPPSGTPQYDAQGNPQPNVHRQSSVPAQQYANYPGSPGHAPPGYGSTASPLPSPTYTPQQYQPMASPPPGGYSQYQYSTTSHSQNPVHQQLYRPTKQEAETVDHDAANPQAPNSNIRKRVAKAEEGIGSLLKKLDKKF